MGVLYSYIFKRRKPSPFGKGFPLWMWGVKEKDMALYKLPKEIIPILHRLCGYGNYRRVTGL